MMNDREMTQTLVARFVQRARATFGDNLVSLVLFGSVARGDFKSTSDVDLLVVFETLPSQRHERYALTHALEEEIAESVPGNFSDAHWHSFSIIRKTRAEAQRTGLYYLDLTTDAIMLYDRDHFFQGVLDHLRVRLHELGSQKVYLDDGSWYWRLKPQAALGEMVEI